MLSVFVRNSLFAPSLAAVSTVAGSVEERADASTGSSRPPSLFPSRSSLVTGRPGETDTPDGSGGIGCRACRGWASTRPIDGDHRGTGEREGHTAASGRGADAEQRWVGRVHRCHAYPGAPRLGSSRGWRGAVDDSTTRSNPGGVVRRRTAALRSVRARGDRFGAGPVAWRRGAPNETGARGGSHPRHRRRGRKWLAPRRRGTTSRAEGFGQRAEGRR